jgi:hypothetical protein
VRDQILERAALMLTLHGDVELTLRESAGDALPRRTFGQPGRCGAAQPPCGGSSPDHGDGVPYVDALAAPSALNTPK